LRLSFFFFHLSSFSRKRGTEPGTLEHIHPPADSSLLRPPFPQIAASGASPTSYPPSVATLWHQLWLIRVGIEDIYSHCRCRPRIHLAIDDPSPIP
jgi:hypothetical protein